MTTQLEVTYQIKHINFMEKFWTHKWSQLIEELQLTVHTILTS